MRADLSGETRTEGKDGQSRAMEVWYRQQAPIVQDILKNPVHGPHG
jgi:hypothetical protein